ncbi:unnamed protein product [Pleuronectes platessa]|uniref:Uncharacterized protein n=1 Tax=Pleuronectes platessa TaxID=8262 RepID=A0A9N7TIZ6_PLEPL|nr:unnamed protein product [Pleuronectes platessa]
MQNLNDSLCLGLVRTMMRLFGKSCFSQRGESWKNPLSFHPTHNESCIYTTPRRPCTNRPRQTGPSQTEGDSSVEQKQSCSSNQPSSMSRAFPDLITTASFQETLRSLHSEQQEAAEIKQDVNKSTKAFGQARQRNCWEAFYGASRKFNTQMLSVVPGWMGAQELEIESEELSVQRPKDITGSSWKEEEESTSEPGNRTQSGEGMMSCGKTGERPGQTLCGRIYRAGKTADRSQM